MTRILAALLILCGVMLHLYVLLIDGNTDSGSLILFLWSCIPYAITGILLTGKPHMALGGVLAVLIADCWSHYRVFFDPASGTTDLQLVFTPFWNLFVIMPLGMLIAHLIRNRLFARKGDGIHTGG